MMLSIKELEAGYGPMQVLWKPSLHVEQGSVTSILGPNGAGKTTLLKAVFGSIAPWRGTVEYEGADVTRTPSHRKVALGMALVPEGKHLFPTMSVSENLGMGAYPKEALPYRDESLDMVYTLFPRLKERQRQLAGLLSGGEQQMVTIGRALMSRPRLIMLDEPSQGLAPVLAREVFDTVRRLQSEMGMTILLVEQNAEMGINASDYVYIMHEGSIKAHDHPETIKASDEIRTAYLGI
jgi:branched-chain amino acid transport system ATP-binding protein